MAFDEDLAARVRNRLGRVFRIEEKKMFGGVVFLLNANVVAGVWKDSLVARLGPTGGDALSDPHAGPFSPAGRPMTGWVLVEPDGVADDAQLAAWLDRAAAFVETLPPK